MRSTYFRGRKFRWVNKKSLHVISFWRSDERILILTFRAQFSIQSSSNLPKSSHDFLQPLIGLSDLGFLKILRAKNNFRHKFSGFPNSSCLQASRNQPCYGRSSRLWWHGPIRWCRFIATSTTEVRRWEVRQPWCGTWWSKVMWAWLTGWCTPYYDRRRDTGDVPLQADPIHTVARSGTWNLTHSSFL